MKNKKAAVGFIFITLVLDITGLGIIIPVMPDLIKELTNGSIADAAAWGGWLMTSYAAMQFIFAPIVGALSDQYGRRKILLFSLLGFVLNYSLLALAPNIIWLFVGRIASGIMGASMSTASAYISDISDESNRTKNFGLVGAAFGIGFVLGPLIGGVMGDINTRFPFWIAALLSFINLIYGYLVLPESLDKEHRSPFHWRRANPIGNIFQFKSFPIILGLIVCYFIIQIAIQAMHSVWSYYTIEKFEWTKTLIGISLGVVGVLVGAAQSLLTKPISKKLGLHHSLYLGLLLNAIGIFLVGIASQGWMLFVFLVPFCLGGIVTPVFQSIITIQAPKNKQGALQGALTGVMSLSNMLGPLLMTHVFAYFSQADGHFYFPGAPMILSSILYLAGLCIGYFVLNKYKKKNAMLNPEISD